MTQKDSDSWEEEYSNLKTIRETELYDSIDRAIIGHGSQNGVGRGSRDLCHEIAFILAKAGRPLRTGEIINELEYRRSPNIGSKKESSKRNSILRPLRCFKDAGLVKTWVVRTGERGERTDHYLAFRVNFREPDDKDLARRSIFNTLLEMAKELNTLAEKCSKTETKLAEMDRKLDDIKKALEKLKYF